MNLAAIVVMIVLMVGAGICMRDAVALYREAPGDGLFKVPLGAAFALTIVAIVIFILA